MAAGAGVNVTLDRSSDLITGSDGHRGAVLLSLANDMTSVRAFADMPDVS